MKTSSKKPRKLGPWQTKMLQEIAEGKHCCVPGLIDKIGGTRKKFDWRYKQRIMIAIHLHNDGLVVDSPIPASYRIVEDNFGQFGKAGFHLVKKEQD